VMIVSEAVPSIIFFSCDASNARFYPGHHCPSPGTIDRQEAILLLQEARK